MKLRCPTVVRRCASVHPSFACHHSTTTRAHFLIHLDLHYSTVRITLFSTMASIATTTPPSSTSSSSSSNIYSDFQAGVTACLRSWSALRTAVESGWGGGTRESHIKAETLRQNIYQVMDGHKTPSSLDVFDLADDLAIYMEEQFSVTLEDQSEQQVAQTLLQLYEECLQGNPTLARQLVTNAESIVALVHQFPVQVQSASENDEDDDDDEDDEHMVDDTGDPPAAVATAVGAAPSSSALSTPAEYAAQPLFGKSFDNTNKPAMQSTGPVRQLGESIPEEPTMEVDDDGFAPVVAKGRRSRGGPR
jgi:pre-rRNA-processing protein TSR2